MRRWLVVEEVIDETRGVLLRPKFVAERLVRGAFAVRLRRPDGGETTARASMVVSHVRGSLPPFAMLRLHDVSAQDVPVGTEIWDDVEPNG